MSQWSVPQPAEAVKIFYKNCNCATAVRREYRRYFNLERHDPIPAEHEVRLQVKNYEGTSNAAKPTEYSNKIKKTKSVKYCNTKYKSLCA